MFNLLTFFLPIVFFVIMFLLSTAVTYVLKNHNSDFVGQFFIVNGLAIKISSVLFVIAFGSLMVSFVTGAEFLSFFSIIFNIWAICLSLLFVFILICAILGKEAGFFAFLEKIEKAIFSIFGRK